MDLIRLTGFFKDYPILLTSVVSVMALSMLIKILKSLFQFYDEYVLHRPYKKILDLSNGCEKGGVVEKYLGKLRDTEIFRVSSGINASPLKAEALMKLYLRGNVTPTKLRRLSRYLVVSNNSVLEKSISRWEIYFAKLSLILSVILLLCAFVISVTLMITGNLVLILVSLLIMVTFVFFAVFISSDYRDYKAITSLELDVKS